MREDILSLCRMRISSDNDQFFVRLRGYLVSRSGSGSMECPWSGWCPDARVGPSINRAHIISCYDIEEDALKAFPSSSSTLSKPLHTHLTPKALRQLGNPS